MSRHLDLLHRRVNQHGAHNVDINQVHRDSLSLNDRIARWVARHIGVMWFCYGIATLMLAWALLNMLLLPSLHSKPIDPLPFPLLFFFLGGVFQTLMLPMLMVAQNLDTRHSEIRAELDHHIAQESIAKLEEMSNTLALLKLQSEARLRKRKIPTELPIT